MESPGKQIPRRRRWTWALIVLAGLVVCVTPVALAVTWALTATPLGPRTPPGSLSPAVVELMEQSAAASEEISAAFTDALNAIEGATYFDLEVLIEDDVRLDSLYLDGWTGDVPDEATTAARRAAMRARADALVTTLRDQGLPDSVIRMAPPAGATFPPAPIGLGDSIDSGKGRRDIARAARVIALHSVRSDDPEDALAWLEAMRVVTTAGESLGTSLSHMTSIACRLLLLTTIQELIAESRGLEDRAGIDAARALLDGLAAETDALGPMATPDRQAAIARWEFENSVRGCTDASGRLVPSSLDLGPWAGPPSAGTRLRRNLPGLFQPSRAELLAKAEPALALFAAEVIAFPLPSGPTITSLAFDGLDFGGALDPESFMQQLIDWISRAHAMAIYHEGMNRAYRNGIHIGVAIERYRFAHGASPRILSDLGLPDIDTMNPWTGEALEYRPGDPADGDRWKLWATARRIDGDPFDLRLHPEAFESTDSQSQR